MRCSLLFYYLVVEKSKFLAFPLKLVSNFKNAFSTGNSLRRPLSAVLTQKKCIQEAAFNPVK